jgi:hypothetical protein
MAFVAGHPLDTSPDTGASFFDRLHALCTTTPADKATPFRFSKQLCGGSNRNGWIFQKHHLVQDQLDRSHCLHRRRPRTALARAVREDVDERMNCLVQVPAHRFRPRLKASHPSEAVGRCRRLKASHPPEAVGRCRSRPQSAPATRPGMAEGLVPLERLPCRLPPPGFKPFHAFREPSSAAPRVGPSQEGGGSQDGNRVQVPSRKSLGNRGGRLAAAGRTPARSKMCLHPAQRSEQSTRRYVGNREISRTQTEG